MAEVERWQFAKFLSLISCRVLDSHYVSGKDLIPFKGRKRYCRTLSRQGHVVKSFGPVILSPRFTQTTILSVSLLHLRSPINLPLSLPESVDDGSSGPFSLFPFESKCLPQTPVMNWLMMYDAIRSIFHSPSSFSAD